jgi:1-acyl-sn-glycerol-3-phosphate acyltransferase
METTSAPVRGLRGAALAGQLVVVWLIATLIAPRLTPARRRRVVARCAARTLSILRVTSRVHRVPPLHDGAMLVVANHVSWLDVYVLNAALGGTRSVAKREVASWPVAGAIARGFATFFHTRGSGRDAARVKDDVAAALRAGEPVVVFPEGTTTEGDGVARFHPAFLQAAIDAGVPVQPVAIRYARSDGALDRAAAFVGDMTFLASLLRVLRRPRLEARLTFGPRLHPHGHTRRDLAAASHAFVARALTDRWPGAPRRPAPLRLPRAA